MSALIILPIMIPATTAVWPAVAVAAAAATSALGFSAVEQNAKVDVTATEVSLDVDNCTEISSTVNAGDCLTFVRDDITLTISRDNRDKVSVKVHSHNYSKEELKEIGNQVIGKLTQQYAYNRVVTELKQRNFNLVDQEVEEDGTVRLKVRVYQ